MLTPRPGRLAARVLLPALFPLCVLAATPEAAPPPDEALGEAPAEAETAPSTDEIPAEDAAHETEAAPPLALDDVSNALALVAASPDEPMADKPIAMKRPSISTLLTVPPFSDYEIILLRKPFGNPPPVPVAPVPVDNSALLQAQEEQKLAKQIHMVAVNKTPSGRTAVGFIDKSDKPERNYYINVGDTVNGYTVVEASYEDETATLTKEGVTITLKLGQGLIKGGGAPGGAAPPGGRVPLIGAPSEIVPAITPPPIPAPTGEPSMPPAAASALRTLNSESFRERLTRQRAEREAADAARQQRATLDAEARAEKITKDELEKATREINLNLIRQGMNPLSPITLTAEEDAEMVKLGVLQAQ